MEFSSHWEIRVQLAYYPPYHSKYNPIERVFGVLEKYWNGDPLRTVEKALGMAEGMTYNRVHPIVELVLKEYKKGIKLSAPLRRMCEQALDRLPALEKWFITIVPEKSKEVCAAMGNME